MGVARLVGARKVELPILMQQTDGLLHGMRRRPLPIHTLQVVGRPQPGTHRHGHPIRTRKAEDKHPRGMPRLAHPILIVVAVVAARQVEAEALVGLFRALGGGWPLKENLPDVPKPEPAVAAAVKYLVNPQQGPLNPGPATPTALHP